MSQKNETTALIVAFLVTASLVAGGGWLLFRNFSRGSAPVDPSASQLEANSPNSAASSPSGSLPVSSGFAQVQPVPSGLFNYGGSTTWAPLRLSVDSAMQAARPEFRLRYVQPTGGTPGTATGIQMVIRGEVAFAQTSRPITEAEYQQAQQRGVKLNQIPVAIDGIAVVVHPDLAVNGLTLQQLAGIYRGNITNWQSVGGPNLPIRALSRPKSAGGTVELFDEQVLQKQPFGPQVQSVATTTDAVRLASQTPGSIYFASAPEVVPQCKVKPIALGRTANELVPAHQGDLVPPANCPAQRNRMNMAAFQSGQYPLTRNLYVVVKQNGQTEQQAGEAYANLLLSGEGQGLIEKSGFVRIR
jgi:phosphate transport system substrate-binding protein